jgi:hypothetical protein
VSVASRCWREAAASTRRFLPRACYFSGKNLMKTDFDIVIVGGGATGIRGLGRKPTI